MFMNKYPRRGTADCSRPYAPNFGARVGGRKSILSKISPTYLADSFRRAAAPPEAVHGIGHDLAREKARRIERNREKRKWRAVWLRSRRISHMFLGPVFRVVWALRPVIALFLAVTILVSGLFLQETAALAGGFSEVESGLVFDASDGINLVLLATDAREDGGSMRTDSIIVLSIDRKTRVIGLTSLLRDTAVDLPGVGTVKLNAVASHVGFDGLCELISSEYGINVDGWMRIDLLTAYHLFDAVGGSRVTLEPGEAMMINGYLAEQNRLTGDSPETSRLPDESFIGVAVLDGRQAVAYARNRYTVSEGNGRNDFGRTSRQREVLTGAAANLKEDLKRGRALKLVKIMRGLPDAMQYIETSLSDAQCRQLFRTGARAALRRDVRSGSLPEAGNWADGPGYTLVTLDSQKNIDYFAELLR